MLEWINKCPCCGEQSEQDISEETLDRYLMENPDVVEEGNVYTHNFCSDCKKDDLNNIVED